MGTPYLAEMRVFPYGFAPKGWAQCNGQLMSIAQNQALFSLLGTNYGGDGVTTFALPDLRGRVPAHWGSGAANGFANMVLGQKAGETTHTVITPEMPAHSHLVSADGAQGTSIDPSNNVWALAKGSAYAATGPQVAMAADAITAVGGSQPHPNMAPYLTLNICIALTGAFPSRN